jgi:deoxyribodipyrimidine photo-lyase
MPSENLPSNHQLINWDKTYAQLNINTQIKPITWLTPGPQAAQQTLQHFLVHKAATYATDRNDPAKNALSNLSPYLHFGHISAQHIALQTTHLESFFEELVVRRELADNFCHYNPHYDSLAGAPNWSQQTLADHQHDPREYLYTQQELEQALTHDPAWNAAQVEMVTTGKMHGYMRMYWAKKILEWTPSPTQAYQIAIYLNDTYNLDGRDPNGFTGIAWAIAGIHDRPWKERPIFGKIRYMNYNGLKRKFEIQRYIDKFLPSQMSLFN